MPGLADLAADTDRHYGLTSPISFGRAGFDARRARLARLSRAWHDLYEGQVKTVLDGWLAILALKDRLKGMEKMEKGMQAFLARERVLGGP